MGIGKRIQDRRKELNLSVEEIAKRLNKNRTTVYRYEKGDIENLPLETLKPLAEILETTPAYLMGWESESKDEINKESSVHKRLEVLIETVKQAGFTDNECKHLVEYANYLVYRRNIK